MQYQTKDNNEFIRSIYDASVNMRVDTLRDETLKLLVDTVNTFINTTQKKDFKILEIGTGVGYSAAAIVLNTECNLIVSIEKDYNRYLKAVDFLRDFDSIQLLNIDCNHRVFDDELKVDLLILDGPKANQVEIIKHYMKNLNNPCMIFIDNIYLNKFRNLTSPTNNQVKILNELERLVEWIKNQKVFKYQFYDIDDGVVILYR